MMLQAVTSDTSPKLAFVLRKRFEFGLTLLLAALLPWALNRWWITDNTFDAAVFHNSLIANVMAICLALWIRISVSTYPGIRSGQIVLPAVFVAHSAMLILLVLARIPYLFLRLAAVPAADRDRAGGRSRGLARNRPG
jgi:hypothetical protein